MIRAGLLSMFALSCFLPGSAWSDDDEAASPKTALQALNEFIGEWRGRGALEGSRANQGDKWQETVSWSWKFKGDEAWLTMAVKKGKFLKSGELRYLADKKKYQLTALTKDDKKAV